VLEDTELNASIPSGDRGHSCACARTSGIRRLLNVRNDRLVTCRASCHNETQPTGLSGAPDLNSGQGTSVLTDIFRDFLRFITEIGGSSCKVSDMC
jgi:hypothetical protein